VKIVVTGYASLDYAVRLDSPALPDHTATILSRPSEWPRLGGSPAYLGAALAASGVGEVALVSWVGDDAEGARYCEGLRTLGLETEGVNTRPGRTPVCLLAYQPDGGCLCLYDPGLAPPIALSPIQRALIAAADVLCVTVGPADGPRVAVALSPPCAKLVWAVKADSRATPPDLAEALAARANIVVHSRGERDFVAAADVTADAIQIETRGPEGVAIYAGGIQRVITAAPLAVEDSTGAGDTWTGGFLAAYLVRGMTLADAAQAGAACARAMLTARTAQA
jgi:ribokinase